MMDAKTELMEAEQEPRKVISQHSALVYAPVIAEQGSTVEITVQSAKIQQVQHNASEGQNSLTLEEEIKKVNEWLKTRYLQTLRVCPIGSRDLEQIYIDINIQVKEVNKAQWKRLSYKQFIQELTNLKGQARLLLSGEAGVGKTTLLSKIAYDWATGKHLQEVELLFLFTLREVDKGDCWVNSLLGELIIDRIVDGERVQKHICMNPRKSIILIDGLEEYKGDIKVDKTPILEIIRGKRLPGLPVVLSSRPWQVRDITIYINQRYKKFDVCGFEENDVKIYAKRFFGEEKKAAKFIEFLQKNAVVSESMTKYPIFCCMICQLWDDDHTLVAMDELDTFSRIIKTMIHSLIEQYLSSLRRDNRELELVVVQDECNTAFRDVGELALSSILESRPLSESEYKTFPEIVYKVGIISRKSIPTPLKVRMDTGKEDVMEARFPHELIKEYLAGLYVASLQQSNPAEFTRRLEGEILKDYRKFMYLIYFLAGQGTCAGKALMEALCKKVNDDRFIMQVGFECHVYSDALAPAVDYFLQKTSVTVDGCDRHTRVGGAYTMKLCLEQLKKAKERQLFRYVDTRPTQDIHSDPDRVMAMGIIALPNISSLTIRDCPDGFQESFFEGICDVAVYSQIKNLTFSFGDEMRSMIQPKALSATATNHFAKGLFSMPNLTSLTITAFEWKENFYTIMSKVSATSKIKSLTFLFTDGMHNMIRPKALSATASDYFAKSLFSMPDLTSLTIRGFELKENFYTIMSKESATSKIKILKYIGTGHIGRLPLKVNETASFNFAKGLFSMPNLRSLTLKGLTLHESFFSRSVEVSAKIENLTDHSIPSSAADERAPASQFNAIRLFTMSSLKSLETSYISVDEGFFGTMLRLSSASKITTMNIRGIKFFTHLTPSAMKIITLLPCIRSLTLINMTRVNEKPLDLECTHDSSVETLTLTNVARQLPFRLGLPALCPRLKHLTIQDSNSFHQTKEYVKQLSQTLHTSCRELVSLTITNTPMCNDGVSELLNAMKGHAVQKIRIENCCTDSVLDRICDEISSEGRLTVRVKHGKVDITCRRVLDEDDEVMKFLHKAKAEDKEMYEFVSSTLSETFETLYPEYFGCM